MQRLNSLTQVMSAASTVADIARKSVQYRFMAADSMTLYVHIAGGALHLHRTESNVIEISAALQAPFAWRIAAEQDDAGVYFVALRRAVIGGIASAAFTLSVPQSVHVILRLEQADFTLGNISGMLEIPPSNDGEMRITSSAAGL
ncbi:MAG: hypothetical protein IAE89_06605 [Anaerolineae bacterium]|nr:hypothetical protein [Anaerolineae bacterium]